DFFTFVLVFDVELSDLEFDVLDQVTPSAIAAPTSATPASAMIATRAVDAPFCGGVATATGAAGRCASNRVEGAPTIVGGDGVAGAGENRPAESDPATLIPALIDGFVANGLRVTERCRIEGVV